MFPLFNKWAVWLIARNGNWLAKRLERVLSHRRLVRINKQNREFYGNHKNEWLIKKNIHYNYLMNRKKAISKKDFRGFWEA